MTGQSAPVRNWAKINVELRSATRELQKAEFEETNIKHESLWLEGKIKKVHSDTIGR